ncbi:MAG: UDP-forming cellulose synthase catalytic subunit [Steroidobacteraceae bacterium]|nr:UDP-forming cellulose synthase catalytic subunit [Steroidobacteraceae bacterium]
MLLPVAAAAIVAHSLLVPVHLRAQAWIAWALVAVFALGRLLLPRLPAGWRPAATTLLLTLGAFVTLRYFAWRALHTLSLHDPMSLLASVTLLAAEAYGICMLLLGIWLNVEPLRRRPVAPVGPTEQWPPVDVLIPTYDEEPELLELTLIAATQIRYPASRLRVFLCDDGGTAQQISDRDSGRAQHAAARAGALRTLCARVGATYLTRERNECAKAGNLNEALRRTSGDLILVLDADHVPTEDFLENTVGLFQRDRDLFLVQTPHFFISADPVEKNLRVFGSMPSENEMFYARIQHGLDFWESSFFCGSAAVLRRCHLEAIGGLASDTVTEDAESALALHARGLKSAYVDRPMIAGLQPATYASYVVQRMRWAQGMAQIFLLKNPLRTPGLTLSQRLAYFNSTFFWFFAFARVVFLLAPAAYLVFGLRIFEGSLAEFTAYALPHVIGVLLIGDLLFGRVRWALTSELYELLQAMYNLPALLQVIRDPRRADFRVTPKGTTLQQQFITELARPFYAIYVLSLLSVFFGAWRWFAYPDTRDATVITLCWLGLNLVLLHAALGALFERRQLRRAPRMPANRRATLALDDGHELAGRIVDLSAGGAAFRTSTRPGDVREGSRGELRLFRPGESVPSVIRVELRRHDDDASRQAMLGLAFQPRNLAEQRVIVSQVFGDSRRWQVFRTDRARDVGVLWPVWKLFSLGVRYAVAHFAELVRVGFGTLVHWTLAALGSARRQLRWLLFPRPVREPHEPG